MHRILVWLSLAAGCVTPAAPSGDSPSTEPCVDCDARELPAPPGDRPRSDGGCDGSDTGETDTGEPDTGCAPGELPAVPGELLDLSDWKIQLPIGEAESPMEVEQPELDTYAVDPWFQLTPERDAVVFRANAGGVTTSGSSYPRSELREMDGAERAAWSTSSGIHSMTITQAITALPPVKPHVVAGQIHDAEDDVVMVRLEGQQLFVEGGGENLGDLDQAYVLGEVFTVRVEAAEGWIDVYYQDLETPAVSVSRDTDGCYFKAGVYTQSNTDRGDAPEAFGEVQVRELYVTHE